MKYELTDKGKATSGRPVENWLQIFPAEWLLAQGYICEVTPKHYSVELDANGYISPGDPSKVTRNLIDQLIQRDAHGQQKYGTSLDRRDLDLGEWLQHMTEELLDGAGYAQAALREFRRLKAIEDAAREFVKHYPPPPWANGADALLKALGQ